MVVDDKDLISHVLRCLRTARVSYRGLEADDSVVEYTVAVNRSAASPLRTGHEVVKKEIAIAHTAPAPIDMEIALAIIPIEHESMCCRPLRVIARVEDGARSLELC